jgi:RNA polymerase sigma-B factor
MANSGTVNRTQSRTGDAIRREVERYRVTGSLPPCPRTRKAVSLPADETELLRLYAETRDPLVREDVVQRFLPLARSLALRYRGSTEQLDDLFQVANLALVKALDRFDPSRGKSFVAFAAPTILGELRRHFRDRVWELRLPRDLQERTMEVRKAARTISDELGRSPALSQIAQHLELSQEEVTEALQAEEARRTLSLDVPTSREDAESPPMVETVGHREPGYEAVETQLAANDAQLTERETEILRMRFEEDLTQYEIGDRIGVSQMQVSRIMRGALRKLVDAVQSSGC